MKKKKNTDDIFSIACVVFLLFMMCTIGIRFLTRQIVVEKLKINNIFTDIVFCDNKALSNTDGKNEKKNDINWAELYPFDIEITEKTDTFKNERSLLLKYSDKIRDKIISLESSIEDYSTENLFGYSTLTALSKYYESYILWNFTPFEEYNSVLKMGKNYFYGIVPLEDVSESAKSTIKLSNYCDNNGITFLYVQAPSKISKYEDVDISGVTDFSNQNADSFLQMLNEKNVNTFDLREEIHKEELNHHSLFYDTDHHWKGETGLWAAKKLFIKMQEFGFDISPEILLPEKFEYVVYDDWFLGSQGKKVTLAKATPEDISLIYPKENTKFHYVIPNLEIDEIGDFSVTYMMDCIKEKDYMQANPYGAYNHADQPLIQIENMLIDNEYKALIIHDSFANCVIPFMALGIKNIDSIDLRHFNGSLRKYIKESNPDVVIVTYQCSSFGKVDYSTHDAIFDFR